MRRYTALLVAIGVVVLAACADRTPTGPAEALARANPGPVPGDTTHHFDGVFTVHGLVRGVAAVSPSAGSNDTLRFEPVAGARIRIMHNVLVNGVATQELAAETVSDAGGAYAVSELEGGYYIVQVAPPEGSPYGAGWEYLPGLSPDVMVDVYLWKQP